MILRFEEFTRNISQAYKYILKIKSKEMGEYGLKASNVTCLFHLGQHPDGLTATELCEKCMEDKAGVSKSLSLLKEKGFVLQDDERKYKAKYTVTEEGRKVFDEIKTVIENIVCAVGDNLTEDERETFYRALGMIVKNLEKICEETEQRYEFCKKDILQGISAVL